MKSHSELGPACAQRAPRLPLARAAARGLLLAITAALLSACGGSSGTNSADDQGDTGGEPVNAAPEISGSPPGSVQVGNAYNFVPSASDPDGDALVFSVANKPSWAEFETGSGTLSGNPGNDDAGNYPNILISVSDSALSSSLPAFDIDVVMSNPPPGNSAPEISGTPPLDATPGQMYDFLPESSDADGDTLTFSIINPPSWTEFDSDSGRLSGMPTESDAGEYANISISVSDGIDSAELAPFTITVRVPASGSVVVTWQRPDKYEDGSPLAAVSAYRVDYGTDPANLDRSLTVANGAAESATIGNLGSGTWYFTVIALDPAGAASEPSAIVSRELQ